MDVVKLCSEMVKIKTENPPGDTRDCAEFVGDYLESIGIPVSYTYGPDGRTNVYSRDQTGNLLLLGHMDVVPAIPDGWDHPPYSGFVDETYVHGRGSADMKGGCAALMSALSAVQDKGLDVPVSVALVCDEEGGGRYGTRQLLAEKIIKPCDCLIAEPTPANAPCIGQKGVFRFTVNFTGDPGHSSLYPQFGTSAIMQASEFLAWVSTLHEREYPLSNQMEEVIAHSCSVAQEIYGGDFSSVFRRIAYNPGIIEGGERENIVAQRCSLVMDMRLPWGVSRSEIEKEISEHLPKTAAFRIKTAADASMTEPDSFLVKTVCSCIGDAYGINCRPMAQWAASDARALRLAGFRAVEYGPGELKTMHAVNERVRIDQLNTAAGIYTAVMEKYGERK
jgi:succinyl-diaminopimelate desuccinylase